MIEPAFVQISRHDWVFVLEVPQLPDVGEDVDRLVTQDLLFGYHALAECLAGHEPGEVAVQVRMFSPGAVEGRPEPVALYLVGRAESPQHCLRLLDMVHSSIPTEVELWPVECRERVEHILHVDSTWEIAEVRRRTEELGAYTEPEDSSDFELPGVLRWAPDAAGLRHAATRLAVHPHPAMIVLHMEPTRPSWALLEHLDDTIRSIVSGTSLTTGPLEKQMLQEHRRRIRDFRRGALHVRVLIAANELLQAGLCAAVGLGLTDSTGYDIARSPNVAERASREAILRIARNNVMNPSLSPIDELHVTADVDEAARVVRFPLPVRGGTVGLRSTPVVALPRAAEGTASRSSGIFLGASAGGGEVSFTHAELNQHLLIAGLPGFGKSLTAQSILARVHEAGVPFLVFDPAKSDYRRLANILGNDLRVIDLSPETVAFNPFGTPERASPITHAGRVLASFDAAFSLSSTWPPGYVTLARAVYRTYDEETVPTLGTLRHHLNELIQASGYTGETKNNLQASLLGRIDFLMNGPLGVALSGSQEASVDWDDLTSRPTVIELRRFAGPLERSLVFALLLSGLITYREANPSPGTLGHLVVLEEAHRLLRNPNTGPQSEGVRMFVEAIAEQRGSGSGFMIVDQAPTMLDPGVMKLTGSVCTHRLVDPDERTTVGAALLLDDRQREDLARLRTGQAVVHSTTRTAGAVVDIVPPPALMLEQQREAAITARLPWRRVPAAKEPLSRRVEERARSVAQKATSSWNAMATLTTELHGLGLNEQEWAAAMRTIETVFRQETRNRRSAQKGQSERGV
ncbi:ATP-binding protein [Kocuria rosea]|uniref:ATP-binding protein n=1 Tax=Kocuria rosea TaxID=1275 RepID=UPI0025B741AE|nr:DUF87 domain-containing protein [Kocuria rosea]WJZ68347.1 DUF87 domain-containing protein [Kocuria rosea]